PPRLRMRHGLEVVEHAEVAAFRLQQHVGFAVGTKREICNSESRSRCAHDEDDHAASHVATDPVKRPTAALVDFPRPASSSNRARVLFQSTLVAANQSGKHATMTRQAAPPLSSSAKQLAARQSGGLNTAGSGKNTGNSPSASSVNSVARVARTVER